MKIHPLQWRSDCLKALVLVFLLPPSPQFRLWIFAPLNSRGFGLTRPEIWDLSAEFLGGRGWLLFWSRPGKPNQKESQNKKFMNFTFFVNSGVSPWENKHNSHRILVQICPREKFMNWPFFGVVCQNDSWSLRNEIAPKGINCKSKRWEKKSQGLKSWVWLPKYCRTCGVLKNLLSTSFSLCETFRRTFLQNPKGAAEFWGEGGARTCV